MHTIASTNGRPAENSDPFPEVDDQRSGEASDRRWRDIESRLLNASPSQPTPAGEAGDRHLATYLGAVRAHWRLVLLVTLAALVGSLAVVFLNRPDYEATAEVLVAPVVQDDQTLLGLDLLRDSGDPTRDVQTAASLIHSPQTAKLTANRLANASSPMAILEAVRVEPKGDSNVLNVTATAQDPELAARTANTFVEASFALRSRQLRRQLDALIDRLEARSAAETNPAAVTAVAERLTALEALRASDSDPTLSTVRPASAPVSPVGAPEWLIVAAALLGGLVLGALAAFGARLLDTRVADQDELLTLYPLPLLSGVPQIPGRDLAQGGDLPPEAFEAFRTLATQLQSYGTGRTVLVTSASSGDGKSTVAANLALGLAEAGRRVVLVDLDVRKPELSESMGHGGDGHDGSHGPIVQSLRHPRIQLLPATPGGSRQSLGHRVSKLLPEALRLADYVIIDSSPLGEVTDALPVATQVDDVIMVVRLRHSQRASLQVARDLLQRSGVTPRGLVLVGETLHQMSSSYYMRAFASRDAPTAVVTKNSASG